MNQPTQRGKLVVIAMFLAAVLLGGFAWWYNLRSNPRCRAFWGADSLVLIETASHVDFLRLEPAESPTAAGSPLVADDLRIEAAGSAVVVAEVREISRTSGQLVNARHSLVVDPSYRWESIPPQEPPRWDFGLRFVEGSRQLTVLFALDEQRLEWVEQGRGLLLVPAIAAAFRKKQLEWSRAGSTGGSPP